MASDIDTYIRNEKRFKARVGDRVFIFRKAKNYEYGWQTIWVDSMDQMVGKHGTIIEAGDKYGNGIIIEVDELPKNKNQAYFPYTCLNIIR